MNLGYIYFKICIFQWRLGTANAFDTSSVYYPKLRAYHVWPGNCYASLVKFYIVPFQLFAYLFLSRTSKLMGNRQIYFLLLNKLRLWLFPVLKTFAVFLGHIVYNMF